jgi:creatinine amidohydrolase
MKPYILEETNWKNIKNQKYEVALLPWGATEPHNFHLPYGTDSLETAKIAEDAAEKAWQKGAKVMVLPTIPLGVQNPGQIELPFCLHTRPSTQTLILADITKSLHNQGIKKLIIMNGHGGNDFKPLIREIQPLYPDMFIGLTEWFKILKNSDYFELEGDHANEMETSIIQYYFPDLVLPLDQAGEGNSKKFKLNALNSNIAWTPRRWDKVSEDTGIGNPKKANPEKGKQFLDDVTSKIADFIIELNNCDLDDLYC